MPQESAIRDIYMKKRVEPRYVRVRTSFSSYDMYTNRALNETIPAATTISRIYAGTSYLVVALYCYCIPGYLVYTV